MDEENYKKSLLKQLISTATKNLANKSIEEASDAIKKAIGVYKNFSKEWDTLKGRLIGEPAERGASPATEPSPGAPELPVQVKPNLQMPQMPQRPQMPRMPQQPQGQPSPLPTNLQDTRQMTPPTRPQRFMRQDRVV